MYIYTYSNPYIYIYMYIHICKTESGWTYHHFIFKFLKHLPQIDLFFFPMVGSWKLPQRGKELR